jgi:hypothetical protein
MSHGYDILTTLGKKVMIPDFAQLKMLFFLSKRCRALDIIILILYFFLLVVDVFQILRALFRREDSRA